MTMRRNNLKSGNLNESEQFFNTNIKNLDNVIVNIFPKAKINVTKKQNKYICMKGKNEIILELFEINGADKVRVDIKNMKNSKEGDDLKKFVFGIIKGYFCD